MVISKYEIVSFSEVSELTITERGEGGFGHSGVN
jgi:dUTPase